MREGGFVVAHRTRGCVEPLGDLRRTRRIDEPLVVVRAKHLRPVEWRDAAYQWRGIDCFSQLLLVLDWRETEAPGTD